MLSVNDLSIPEGDTGTTNASLTVALSAPSGKPISVDYSTADGSADSSDYAGISGTVSLAPGETSRTVDVAVSGDRTYEPDETFTFALQNPVNATLGSTSAAVTIQNDDAIPQISIDDQTAPEGDSSTTNATLTISLSNPSMFAITVDYATADGTATSPADYTSAAGTVSFAPGVITRTFTVPIVGDTLDEFDETFARQPLEPDERHDRRQPGRRDDHGRRCRSIALDLGSDHCGGRCRQHHRDVHRLALGSFG